MKNRERFALEAFQGERGSFMRGFYKSWTKTNRRATSRVDGGGLPCPFLKIEKKCPDFAKKCTFCGHLWVKFSHKMQEKNTTAFSYGAFALYFLCDTFIKVPLFQETSPAPRKFLVARLTNIVKSHFWRLLSQFHEKLENPVYVSSNLDLPAHHELSSWENEPIKQ